ncbi:MAG: SCO family protein [Rhodocyclaceae bacterium]
MSGAARSLLVVAALSPALFAGAAQATGPAATTTRLDANGALARSDAAVGLPVGEFTLLDRNGRPVRLADYRGKPLLVSFVYTGCFAACPTATRNLHRAVEKAVAVLGPGRFNVVSIGFNQPFDSPEAMAAFARKHGIALPNWEFLSPPAEAVDALTRNFGFSYVATPAGFDHVTQVALVDAGGIIRRQVYGERPDPDELVEPLKRMVVGAALPARGGGLREILDRVRILCSVYDAASGEYRVSYAFVIEVVGFAVFFLATLAFVWREFRRQRPLGRP